jgi:purine-cytosine permease-like protein
MTKVLADSNQNFWQLACIQSSAQSVPGILLGWNLAKDFGAGTALISIFLGNLILWLIGLSIISMSSDKKIHALENVKDFLGKTSSIVAMLILSIAFMSWYVLAIKTSVTGIKNLFPIANQSEFFSDVRLGTVLGLITALIVIGGIGAIRKFCTWAFPFIFLFLCYTALYSNYNVDFSGSWGISLYAVLTCVAITLPGFINLPTFFRHSRSKADSFFALTLITLFDSTIASSSIIIGAQDAYTLNFKCFWQTSTTLDCGLSVIFIVLCLICLNLVNIYFVSAGGELIFYRYWNSKEYAIIGLLGTGAYALLQCLALYC